MEKFEYSTSIERIKRLANKFSDCEDLTELEEFYYHDIYSKLEKMEELGYCQLLEEYGKYFKGGEEDGRV